MRHPLLCMPSMNLTRYMNISMAYHFNMPPLGLALVLGDRLAPSPCPSTWSPLPRPLRRVAAARLGYRLASLPSPAPLGGLLPGGFPGNHRVEAATDSHHLDVPKNAPPILQKVGIVGIVGIIRVLLFNS